MIDIEKLSDDELQEMANRLRRFAANVKPGAGGEKEVF